MIDLTIEWDGRSAADFARVFDTAAVIDDFRPALKDVGSKVIGPSIGANFSAGGRPPWAPLAPSTIERKSREGAPSPTKILYHSGALQRAATDSNKYKLEKNSITAAPYGVKYWIYHQQGTPQMPQRTIMMLQVADRTKINKIFADYIRTFMTFDPRLPGARQFTGGGVGLGT